VSDTGGGERSTFIHLGRIPAPARPARTIRAASLTRADGAGRPKPTRRRASARGRCRRGSANRALSPLPRSGSSEIEFIAGDPDAMHDHGELASHGDGGALHAPTFGDGDTPGLQTRPLPGTGYQHGCGFVEEMSQHSIAASADLPRSVDRSRPTDTRAASGRDVPPAFSRCRSGLGRRLWQCMQGWLPARRRGWSSGGDRRPSAGPPHPEPPRMRPGTTTICGHSMPEPARSQKFQFRRGDVLAMNAVPGTLVVSPSRMPPASIRAMRTSGIVCDRRPATTQSSRARPDDDVIPAPRRR
jgi:hypothetical protein